MTIKVLVYLYPCFMHPKKGATVRVKGENEQSIISALQNYVSHNSLRFSPPVSLHVNCHVITLVTSCVSDFH